MPRLVLVEDGRAKPLAQRPFLDEAALQRLLEENPELIALDDVDPSASPLVPIGREVALGGQSLDLLFLDVSGRLTAVEVKLRRNPQIRREVVGQVVEYASFLATWSIEDVERQAGRYLADAGTPARFRNKDIHEALAQVGPSDSDEEHPDHAALRERIADSLGRGNLRLVIAVDRIVDALRNTVTFLNEASRFGIFLLEVEEYIAPNELKIASTSVYGAVSKRTDTGAPPGGPWDEARFLEVLHSQAASDSSKVVEELYAFMRDESDSVVWGTGTREGSAGFGIRRGGDRFSIFGATTRGQVYVSTGNLNRRLPADTRAAFVESLRSLGINAPDSLLEGDTWLTFDAEVLKDSDSLARFKDAARRVQSSA